VVKAKAIRQANLKFYALLWWAEYQRQQECVGRNLEVTSWKIQLHEKRVIRKLNTNVK
jgi:hypothetical protein